MNTKSSQDMHISIRQGNLSVSLTWFERDESDKVEFKYQTVRDFDPKTLEAVRTMLNDINANSHITAIGENNISIVFEFPKFMHSAFDLAIQSANPLDALVTPYTIITDAMNEVANA
jgi:hypothetical protein